jgi:hypothetical protein
MIKKIIFVSVFFVISINLYTQNCQLPSEAEHYWLRAKAAVKSMKIEEDYMLAIRQLQKVIEYAPDCPDAYYNLAVLYTNVVEIARDDYYDSDMEFDIHNDIKYQPVSGRCRINNGERKKWELVDYDRDNPHIVKIFNDKKQKWDLIRLCEKVIDSEDARKYINQWNWETKIKQLNINQVVGTMYILSDDGKTWEILQNNNILEQYNLVVDDHSEFQMNKNVYKWKQADNTDNFYTYQEIKNKLDIRRNMPKFNSFDKKLDYYLDKAVFYLKIYIGEDPSDVKNAKELLARLEIKQEKKALGLSWKE